jgi:gluconolactonase
MRLSWLVGCLALAAGFSMAQPPLPLAEKLKKVKVERYAIAPGYSEGPTWRDGELFFCCGALLRIGKDRKVRKYLDLEPAGTFLKADGSILICDNKVVEAGRGPALVEVDRKGKVGVIVEQFQGKRLNGLNDLTVDRDGNVYWTDPAGSSREKPIGRVFRVTPGGRVDRLADDLAFPNGLEVDPDNRYLYVIESQTAKVLRYDLPKEAEKLGRPVVFHALGGSGGDGCVFDAEGNLWVADFHRLETKRGQLTVLSPVGKVLGHLPIPAGQVSNVTFGGKHHDEVFVTTGTPPGVFRARVGVKGFKGHPGKPMKWVRTLPLAPVDEPIDEK